MFSYTGRPTGVCSCRAKLRVLIFVVLNLFLRIVYDFLWYKVVFFMACTHRASVILELFQTGSEREISAPLSFLRYWDIID